MNLAYRRRRGFSRRRRSFGRRRSFSRRRRSPVGRLRIGYRM